MTDGQQVPVVITTPEGTPVRLYVQTADGGGETDIGFDVAAGLDQVTDAISAVSGQVVDALKKAAPKKFTVEMGFEFKVEQGGLVALFTRVSGDAAIKVTMEWERQDPPAPAVRPA
jgi:hypothetical protein